MALTSEFGPEETETIGDNMNGLSWEELDTVYLPERDRSFTEDRCFLCGTPLTKKNRADEHVFPKWLQHRFDLWNQRMVLLNRTDIPYRSVKIPCCSACNHGPLAELEARVAEAHADGFEGFAQLDRRDLFLWLAKIYYGLMFREVLLPADRTDPDSEPILPPDIFEELRMHHLLLQAIRGAVRWRGFPASIFLFRCQVHPDPRFGFDYRDSFLDPFLALRLGQVAVLANLQDWGAMEDQAIADFETAKTLELHPVQFIQLAAQATYISTLFNRTPKHVVVLDRDVLDVITLPLAGFSGKPLFDSFDPAEYAEFLAAAMFVGVDEVMGGDGIRTYLQDERRAPLFIPWDPQGNVTP